MVKLDEGVVVEEVVGPLRAQHERGHELASVKRLGLAGDDPALEQRHHAVREHLGVYPEVALALEEQQHGVGDLADPHLERRPVLDQRGDVPPDGPSHLPDLRGLRKLQHRPVDLDDVGELGDVDERVAQGAGHLLVRQGDHDARPLGRRLGALHAHPVGAEAVLVRGADVDQRHVHRQDPFREEAGDLAEVDGHEIGAAGVDGLPDVGAREERPVAEGAGEARVDVVGIAEGQQVRDLHVVQLVVSRDHGLDQLLGVAAPRVDPESVSRLDGTHGLLRAGDPAAVRLVPAHATRPPRAAARDSGRTCGQSTP